MARFSLCSHPQIIGADIKLRRYYLYYQVLVVLLKFDFL